MAKRVLVAIMGQSNEQGEGVVLDRTPSYGFPVRDPVGPMGTKRSAWPYLSELLGRRGTMTRFYNAAHGSSSIKAHWCGCVKTWASGTVYYGQLALSGGGIWRCNSAAGAYPTAANAPTGTSNTTGADSIPWVYLGVPESYEVDGYICQPGDANFDPLGYIDAANGAKYGLDNDTGTWDEKWLFMSFGQQDTLTVHGPTSRADFFASIKIVTDYFLVSGYKVAIGFTCYAADATREARYQANLLPGLADALAYYAGNPNVCAGANWRTALGVLPVEPSSAQILTPALQDDVLHLNDAAYVLASEAWRDALVTAGWV